MLKSLIIVMRKVTHTGLDLVGPTLTLLQTEQHQMEKRTLLQHTDTVYPVTFNTLAYTES